MQLSLRNAGQCDGLCVGCWSAVRVEQLNLSFLCGSELRAEKCDDDSLDDLVHGLGVPVL